MAANAIALYIAPNSIAVPSSTNCFGTAKNTEITVFFEDAVPISTGPLFFSVPLKGDRKKSKIWEAMIDTLTMAYLNKLPAAISGSGGHNATLRVACECFRRGLSESEAWEAMQWYNSNRCSPAWSDKALQHKLDDAARIVSGSGEMGKWARNGFQKKVRSFTPPVLPARPARKATPICKQSAAIEEEWWGRTASARGCDLAQWDNAR